MARKPPEKSQVMEHWAGGTPGIRYGEGDDPKSFYQSIEEARYSLEPLIRTFAQFERYAGQRVLEIGVGDGSDFAQFVANGAHAVGIDLTSEAVAHTVRRLQVCGHEIGPDDLTQGDAEALPYPSDAFDLVYSWGVLHHTPDPRRAFGEAHRVLKSGSTLKAMIYHVPSWTGWMVWARHALLRGKPWTSAKQAVYEHLESPGTDAYSVREARELLEEAGFTDVRLQVRLGPGDLLQIKPSSRYQGAIYRVIWNLYPRWLIRALGDRFGLYMLVTAEKPG